MLLKNCNENVICLNQLILDYNVSTFNHNYISHRNNILEYYFLGKPLIDELKWINN